MAILNLFTTAATSPSQRPKQRLRTSTAHLPGPKVKQQTLKKVNSNYDVGWGLKGNHHSDKLPQKLDGADIPPTPPNNAKEIWYFPDTWPELCKESFEKDVSLRQTVDTNCLKYIWQAEKIWHFINIFKDVLVSYKYILKDMGYQLFSLLFFYPKYSHHQDDS